MDRAQTLNGATCPTAKYTNIQIYKYIHIYKFTDLQIYDFKNQQNVNHQIIRYKEGRAQTLDRATCLKAKTIIYR